MNASDWTIYHMSSAYDSATDIWRYMNVYFIIYYYDL